MIFTCFSEFVKMFSKGTSINCSSGLPLSEGWGGGAGWGQAVQADLSYPPPRISVKQCHQLILIAP